MAINPSTSENNGHKREDGGTASSPATSAQEYKVGYGHPPRERRWPPGVSGNPKGRKPKKPTLELDLKRALEQALTAGHRY